MSRLALGPTAAEPRSAAAANAHHPGIPPGDLSDRRLVRSATVGDVQ